MKIAFEHTRADWSAYLRFIGDRSARRRRVFWIAFLSAILVTIGTLEVAGRVSSWHFDLPSALVALGIVLAAILAIGKFGQSANDIPGSWLGPHTWELLADGIHAVSPIGRVLFEWRAIAGIEETHDHLFLRLDEISALVLPKRSLEPVGGAAAVRAEIERLKAAAAMPPQVDTTSADAVTQPAAHTPAQPAVRPPWFSRPWLALPRNLLAGARLMLFLPVRAEHFAPSGRQAVLLTTLTFGLWLLLDRIGAPGDLEIIWFTFAQVIGLGAIAVALLIFLTPRPASAQTGVAFMTAVAAASPFLLLVGWLCALPTSGAWWCKGLMLILPLLTIATLHRAQRIVAGEGEPLAIIKAVVVVAAVWWIFSVTLYVQPRFWYSAEASEDEGADTWNTYETELFRQPDLIDAAVEGLQPGVAGTTEAYFVGFAGYGEQRVFGKEVRFARAALARRLDIDGRSLQLINSPDDDATTPLATVSGLDRALAGVARRMNVDEDVLVLFLTSHGSEEAELSVSTGTMPLESLRGPALRAALDRAGIRWRVIVISACHSGSFIPHLEDEHTLIATAARADRSSFGCTDERDLTYYGEALFRDALPASDSLTDAFERARRIVREHEKAEKITGNELSEPQLWIGGRMRAKVAELQLRTAS